MTLLVLGAGCGRSPDGSPLVVFCAASLRSSMAEVAEAFECREGTPVRIHAAGSQLLGRQIREGADADVLAPADTAVLAMLDGMGLVSTPQVFARNRLVIVTSARPRPDAPTIRSAADLSRPGIRVVLGGPDVPVGRYARASLSRLNLMEDVKQNVLSLEESVIHVVTKVALGEADAGIVYATDTAGRGDLRAIELPTEGQVSVEYPAAIVTRAARPEVARRFVEFLRDAEAQAILGSHGFRPLGAAAPATEETTR